jgi:hypothetical protein
MQGNRSKDAFPFCTDASVSKERSNYVRKVPTIIASSSLSSS